MRIAIFTDTFYPKIDGISVSLINLIPHLVKGGHILEVFCPNDLGKNLEINFGEQVTIHRSFSIPLPSYTEVQVPFPSRKKILKVLRVQRPDVIYMASLGSLGMMGTSIGNQLGIPVVGNCSTLFSEQLMYLSPIRIFHIDHAIEKLFGKPIFSHVKENSFLKSIVWKLMIPFYNKCSLVIAPSAPIEKELQRRKLASPIEVLSFGVPLASIKTRGNKSTGASLLHVGRLSHEKHIEDVLTSFSLLLQNTPQATLDIIGDGPSRASLEIFSRNLGIQNKVKFHGFVPNQKLLTLYKNYDLFITASDMETLGLVVVEAMAAGLPIVGINKNGVSSLVKHGKNGYLCDLHDVKRMAESSLSILKNPSTFEKFSKNSIAFASIHDCRKVAARLEQLFIQVKRKNGAPAGIRTRTRGLEGRSHSH